MKVENVFFHLRLCDALICFVLIACLKIWLVIKIKIKSQNIHNIEVTEGVDINVFKI